MHFLLYQLPGSLSTLMLEMVRELMLSHKVLETIYYKVSIRYFSFYHLVMCSYFWDMYFFKNPMEKSFPKYPSCPTASSSILLYIRNLFSWNPLITILLLYSHFNKLCPNQWFSNFSVFISITSVVCSKYRFLGLASDLVNSNPWRILMRVVSEQDGETVINLGARPSKFCSSYSYMD